MTATSFIDTNILVYAASNAAADQAKRQVARMGCQTLFTEDLNAGQVYDGVSVVNPFAGVTP